MLILMADGFVWCFPMHAGLLLLLLLRVLGRLCFAVLPSCDGGSFLSLRGRRGATRCRHRRGATRCLSLLVPRLNPSVSRLEGSTAALCHQRPCCATNVHATMNAEFCAVDQYCTLIQRATVRRSHFKHKQRVNGCELTCLYCAVRIPGYPITPPCEGPDICSSGTEHSTSNVPVQRNL